jgi:hypothetical protein
MYLVFGFVIDAAGAPSVLVGQALLDPIAVEAEFVERRRAGSTEIVDGKWLERKSTSSQVPSRSSLLRTFVSGINFSPRRMVGRVGTSSRRLKAIRISAGDRERSFGTKFAIDAGPTSSAGFATLALANV